jgi:hypothetical protein
VIVAELMAKLGLVPDQESFKQGHDLVKSLHHAVEAYLGFEGLKKVKEMVEGTVEAAVSAKHLGEQLQISTDAVQELGYAADVTGASSEGMRVAMQRLALGMEHAKKTGSGPLVDALQQLRVPMAALRKENLEQNLEAIANGFAKAGPGVNKTALAMEIFGRQGAQLLPLLNKGAGGIRELRAEAQRLGVVMDKDAIEKAEEFEIAQKRLAATLTGLRNTAVQALLPTLEHMVEGLTEWVKENREAIASTLEAVMRGIAEAFHLVGAAISWATHFYEEHKDIAVSVLVAIAAVLAWFAIQAAIAWIVAFAPVALVIAAIAAIIYGIKKLAEWIVGHSISWKQMWDAVLAGGRAVLSWFAALPGRVAHFFEDVATAIKDAFTDAFDWAVSKAKAAWQAIKDTPVIGHIIRGGSWLVDKGSSVLSSVGAPADFVKMMMERRASVPGAPGAESAARSGVNVTGDTHVTINASGMDADEVKKVASEAAAEHIQNKVRSAYNTLGGGAPPSGR